MTAEDQQSIVITAVSALTALGANARASCAAINAGIVAFQEHDYIRCTPADPEWDEDLALGVARVPFINAFINDIERFNGMAIPALTELMSASHLRRSSLAKTGLLLALPHQDPSIVSIGADTFWLQGLQNATGLGGLGLAKASNDGRVGCFALMREAALLLRSGQLEHCAVGAVDSYLLDHRIAHYDQQWRVKTARNVDGFVPGEAAAMLMLETKACALARGAKPLAEIAGLGFGTEEVDLASSRASSGQGLSDAIREALAERRRDDSIRRVHCGLNGESYFAYEWGLVQTRLGQELAAITELKHPADCVGETGAALSALIAVNAVYAMEKSNTNDSILLFIANDDARRAALVLTGD